jgi:hypothetical protein
MKIQQLLEHHNISRNPFADEDAQTDRVFKDFCIDGTFHPTWDKVYGDPAEPATSVVFGEKGSGKTAMRLQIAQHLQEYNETNSDSRLLVIHYDDFNHFLDRFRERFGGRKRIDRVLSSWHLWDHMDAILSIGVTGIVDRILEVKQPSPAVEGELNQSDVDQLDHHQARDLLLLAACYDQSTAETFKGRWHRLRRRLRFGNLKNHWDLALGIASSVTIVATLIALAINSQWDIVKWFWLWIPLLIAGWAPRLWRMWKNLLRALRIKRKLRVCDREVNPLRQIFMNLSSSELTGQPLPDKDRTDDRYELFCKFQGLLQTLRFSGVIVLVDRIDEPHLINGSADLMKALIWPILDNKFLKHPGLGLKLMLPIELTRYIEKEDRQFYQRARLDKQNMVSSFQWTAEALYDVANSRLKACASDGATPTLRQLFDSGISDRRIMEAFHDLRVPRLLFKFLYRLMVVHCNAHTDQDPSWEISPETFESTLALAQRDQDAFDRGAGAG